MDWEGMPTPDYGSTPSVYNEPAKETSGLGGLGSLAGAFMQLLGGGLAANAQYQSGKSQKALNEYNARIADLKADDALVRGYETETLLRKKSKGMIGSSRAAFAAGGVEVNDVDSTAMNVQTDIARLAEVDALTIRANAAREAWGYKTAAVDLRARGDIAAQEGSMKAIGTLTSVAGNVLYQRYGFGANTKYVTA